MKNSKLRRVLMLMACAVLLVCLSVGATLAYLTSTTQMVENTFSVGNTTFDEPDPDDPDDPDDPFDPEVAIVGGLDETKVDEFGDRDEEATTRVTENGYKIMPAHEYTKDPVVHIGDDSEPVWVFVRIQNEITEIEEAVTNYTAEILGETGEVEWFPNVNGTVHDQMVNNQWDLIAGDTVDGVYAYKYIQNADADVVTFHAFAIMGGLEYDDIKDYAGKSIDVQAYIVQADGFNTAVDAYKAAPCKDWPTLPEDNGSVEEGGEE